MYFNKIEQVNTVLMKTIGCLAVIVVNVCIENELSTLFQRSFTKTNPHSARNSGFGFVSVN